MNTLNFRAILVDPGNTTAERPNQIFGTSRPEINEWADKVLATAIAKNAAVLVYQTVESQVDIITKRGKP